MVSARVIRHFGRLIDSCVVSTDIFVLRLPKCWSNLELGSVPDVFAKLAKNFHV